MALKQKNLIKGILLAFGIIIIVLINFRISQPPSVVPASDPDDQFSAERAALHLPFIASKPNPMGSKANEEVRNYIFEQLELLGLTPELHTSEFCFENWAGTLTNIIAKIKGKGNGQTIMIMGHYDSVVNAPGASFKSDLTTARNLQPRKERGKLPVGTGSYWVRSD